jgi:hypothetical protein
MEALSTTSGAAPEPAVLAEVEADLEALDRAPEAALAELLGESVDAAPEAAIDRLLAEPEAKPGGFTSEEIEAFTKSDAGAFVAAFEEQFEDVARVWSAVDGPQGAGERLRHARAEVGHLAGSAPAVIGFLDDVADAIGATVRHRVAIWDALAAAGRRRELGIKPPIWRSDLEAYSAAPMQRGEIPAQRKAVAFLAEAVPDLVVRAAELGLDRDPRVLRQLTMLGLKLGRDTKGGNMQTTVNDGSQRSARADAPDEVEVRAQLEHAMKDPRYWDGARRDPGYVRKIERGFAKLYGGKQ